MTTPLNYLHRVALADAQELQRRIHESVFRKPNKMIVTPAAKTKKTE